MISLIIRLDLSFSSTLLINSPSNSLIGFDFRLGTDTLQKTVLFSSMKTF